MNFEGWLIGLTGMLLGGVIVVLIDHFRFTHRYQVSLHQILDALSDGVWVVNQQAKTTFVNRRLLTMLQLQEQDILARPLFDLIHPDRAADLRRMFEQGKQAEPAQGEMLLHLRHLPPLHVRFYSVPLRSGPGLLQGALAVLSDLTEADQLQTQLRQKEALYRTMYDHVSDIIYVVDMQGKFVALNPAFARITGYPCEDQIGKSYLTLLAPPVTAREIAAMVESRFSAGNEAILELRVRTASGEERSFEVTVQPCFVDGIQTGFTGVARDITTHKQEAWEELRIAIEYERMTLLNRFIRNASHDLRTPLSIINSSAYLIRRKLPPELLLRVDNHIQIIEAQVMHLNEQINNLFLITEEEGGRRPPDENCNLAELIRAAIQELTPALDRKQQRVSLTIQEPLPPIICQSVDMQRAIRYVLINASSYSPEHTPIEISLTTDARYVCLEVRDHGIGIPPEHINQVFEAFYRVDHARSLNTGGMGLGLTIARAIIEAHDGTIQLISPPEDSPTEAGTTVRFLLPYGSSNSLMA